MRRRMSKRVVKCKLLLRPNSITLSRSQICLRPGCRPVASWNLAYHALSSYHEPGFRPVADRCSNLVADRVADGLRRASELNTDLLASC